MVRMPPEYLPLVTITLPIVAAIFGASWIQNKRLDDIIRRLERIEDLLSKQGERIAKLEALMPPLVHH